jgi:mono/diheme cytochrome c family protein
MSANVQETRELAEPEEGGEPVPRFVWLATAGLVVWGFAYFLLYTGGRDEVGGDGRTPAPEVVASTSADGGAIYASRCASCHQPEGKGVPGAFPPLAGSPWPTGAEEVPVRIVLHGLQGPIDVLGVTYQGAMPAFGAQLGDAEVAAVLTHVRKSFGNTAGPINEAQVAVVRAVERATPWTAAELR